MKMYLKNLQTLYLYAYVCMKSHYLITNQIYYFHYLIDSLYPILYHSIKVLDQVSSTFSITTDTVDLFNHLHESTLLKHAQSNIYRFRKDIDVYLQKKK